MQANRRNLLGAALSLPIIAMPADAVASVGVNPITNLRAMSDRGLWWKLFARMGRLEAAADALTETAAKLSAGTERDAAFDRAERASNAWYQMLWRLLRTPAPDTKAALWKFDYLFKPDDGETPCWNLNHENVRLALDDVRRCLGGES